MVKSLLDGGADINCQNSESSTALIQATWYGHAVCVRLLLERGADASIKDIHPETDAECSALDYAIELGFTEIAELLSGKSKL